MQAKNHLIQTQTQKRKLLLAGVILAVLVLVIGLGAYAASSDDSCGNHLTWSYDEETTTLTISGYGDMYDYGSSSSTAVPWYSYRKEITKVVLDCTNTSTGIGIGGYAFYSCTAVETLTGDESVTSIGSYAFYNCTSLAGLDISGVTALGDHAFYGNDSMTEATVNAAITEVPEYLFQGCESLEKVVLLGDVTEIGAGAFYQCVTLDTLVYSATDTTENIVYIADTVETIGKQAFYGCVSYDDDNEPAGGISTVVFMGDSVEFDAATKKNEAQFYDCEYLSSIALPSAQTEIAPYLLYGCTSLQTVTIPETVTTIGKYAFSSTGLTAVTIPASVTEMGSYVFSDNSALTEVLFADGSALTAVPDYAFYGTGIGTITIPDSVESIGSYAFKDCTALTEIIFGTGVTSLGSYMLYGCTADLVELHFTGEYTYTDADGNEAEMSINDTAFKGILGIGYYPADSTTWPSGTAVTENNIYGATDFIWAAEGEEVSLTDWYTIDEETGTLYIYRDGAMPGYTLGSAPWYSSRASIENIVFNYNPDAPDETYTVTSIGSYAFYGFSALESVTIPAEVTSIGSHAFYRCQQTQGIITGSGNSTVNEEEVIGGMETAAFEEGSALTEIDSYAFAECGYLNDITLPESLEEIGTYAFYECGSSVSYANLVYTLGSGDTSGASTSIRLDASQNMLRSITIDGVELTADEDYEETAEDYFDTLDTFYFTLTESYLESLSEGVYSGVASFDNYALSFTLYIYAEGTDEETVEATSEAVSVYAGLEEIDLANVKTIGAGAFQECIALENVTFGSSLETIGDKAFYDCEHLAEIALPDSVQTIGNYAFAGTVLEEITLPAGANIGSYAFANITTLTEITFTEDDAADALTLGAYAFSGCTGLIEMSLPAEVTAVSEGAFDSCTGLTSMEFEGGVTQIGDSAFNGCTALTTISGLSDVEEIGDSAFYDCSALTTLDLPETLTNDQVGDFAFYRCAGLADESGFVVINGVLYSYVYSILGIDIENYMTGVGNQEDESERQDVSIKAQTVPEEVTEIANYAFYQIFATAGGTSSDVSTVTLEGLEFTCAADDITFEEYAFAGLPLLAGYEGYTATITYPCDDADAWIAKFDAFGLSGTGEALGYRYSTSWSLELEISHVQGDDAVTVEPTCTEEGSFTYTCTRCGETVTEVLDALGHDYDDGTVTKEATCTEEGEITYTCKVCDESTEGHSYTETIAALGHTIDESTKKGTKEATCTEDGEISYTCSVCGETVTETTAALGHTWNEGEVTTEPTCTDEGVRTYTCTVCGETYTETIAVLSETGEHDYTVEETVEATCTEDGSITYTCYVCGDAYTEVIAATGHTPDEGVVTKEATCTEEGEIMYTCTVCGETWTETLAALSETGEHTWDGDVCSVCGAAKPADTSDTASGTVSDTTTDTASGTTSGSTSVQKKTQTLKIKAVKKKTVSCKKLKKKKQTVKVIRKVTGAKTKVTYKKVSGKKCLKVNKKTGKVTIKKGTKKGTYKLKIQISAKKTAAYKAASKTVTVKIKVK